MRRSVRWPALVTGIILALPGCGGEEQPVRIGLLTECRGFLAGFEEAMLAGAELPLLARGGRLVDGTPRGAVEGAQVGGRPVELVRGCTETPEHSVLIEETRRLIEVEHVVAVVGPTGESDAIVFREIARRYPDVTFVPAWSGSQEPTLRRPAPNLFRFETDEAQDVAGLGAFAYRELGWRSAAIIADDYGLGWSEGAAFTAEFCALGGRIVRAEYASFVSDPVARLPGSVDGVAVLISGLLGTPDLIPKLARKLGSTKDRLVVGTYVLEDPTMVAAAGDAIDGVVGGSPIPPPLSTPAMRAHRKAFADAFPGLPAVFAEGPIVLGFHDAMEGLLRGLEAAEGDLSDGGSRLRAELGRLRFELPASPVRLDANRQAVRHTYLKRVKVSAGVARFELVRVVPDVEQTYGGLLSNAPAPGPRSQPCRKATPPPWAR